MYLLKFSSSINIASSKRNRQRELTRGEYNHQHYKIRRITSILHSKMLQEINSFMTNKKRTHRTHRTSQSIETILLQTHSLNE